MNENPPLTAAALITAADAVRTAAAREDRLARQAVTDQWDALREAGRHSAEQIEEMARALMEFQDAIDNRPAIYTNRAARRARARAERMRA